jgi:hypothetical protein
LCVGKDVPAAKAIKKMVVGEIKLEEGDEQVRTMCGSRTGGWSLPCVMSD